jgi:hypothetical protein
MKPKKIFHINNMGLHENCILSSLTDLYDESSFKHA